MKQINKSDFFSCFSVYQTNLYDRLKVLAVITMIIDHLGYYIFPEDLYLRLIGRIAFPIFLFLVGFYSNRTPDSNANMVDVFFSARSNNRKYLDCDFLSKAIAVIN